MKFLCDVHISYKVVNFLKSLGFEAIHVNNILDKWYTKDRDISVYADHNNFILITKDSDFRDSYFLKKSPKKLIKINLGNVTTDELIHLLSNAIHSNEELLTLNRFLIEMDRQLVTFFTDETLS